MLKKSRNPFPGPLEGEKQAEIGLEQASKRLKPGEIYIIYAGFPSKISGFPSSISGSPSKYIRLSLQIYPDFSQAYPTLPSPTRRNHSYIYGVPNAGRSTKKLRTRVDPQLKTNDRNISNEG